MNRAVWCFFLLLLAVLAIEGVSLSFYLMNMASDVSVFLGLVVILITGSVCVVGGRWLLSRLK